MPDVSTGPRKSLTQEARGHNWASPHADENSIIGGEENDAVRDLLRLARRLTGICGRMPLSKTSFGRLHRLGVF
jgi:hypothetical protein